MNLKHRVRTADRLDELGVELLNIREKSLHRSSGLQNVNELLQMFRNFITCKAMVVHSAHNQKLSSE